MNKLDDWLSDAKCFNAALKKFKHPTDLEKLKTRETDRIISLIDLIRKKDKFILWCTPCGEVSNPPSYETIGREARKALALTIDVDSVENE